MQVILTKDVETLGDHGEVKEVSDGYARNYLLPQKMAVIATPGALKDRECRIARIQARAEKKHQDDLEKAQKITNLGSITLQANAGEGGKLFGAITTKELAAVLQDKTGMVIERKNISLDHPIHRLGEFTLSIKFSARVSGSVKVIVTAIKSAQEIALEPVAEQARPVQPVLDALDTEEEDSE
jgi:large subunit ribosomal protein L9